MSITPEEIAGKLGDIYGKWAARLIAIIAPSAIVAINEASHLRAELARVEAERDALRNTQGYLYIGKDGKRKLARDLEDERDAALARAESARREGIEEAAKCCGYLAADLERQFGRCVRSENIREAEETVRALLDAHADGKREGE